jgi:hemoglobin
MDTAVRARAHGSPKRRELAMPPVDPANALERLGGETAVRAWVNHFYDSVRQDPVLAPLFTADLSLSRDKQFRFFVQMLGGPQLYTERYGQPFLRYRHRHIKIGQPERDAWMALLIESLRKVTQDEELIEFLRSRIAPIADHMVNHQPGQRDALHFN